ncbi:MAG: class I SAM-dependent rRNA methyltransferase [Acidimicrobiales bacterium]
MSPLDRLPALSSKRIATRVTPDALRQVRSGHPWVFDQSILRQSHEGAPGDLAVIFNADRDFAAIGLYDPASPIRIKVLHTGKPTAIDASFFAQSFSSAIERREALYLDRATTGHRLVHGENDGLPGFIVDRYDSTLVVKVYTPAWFPHLATMVEQLLHVWDRTCQSIGAPGPERVVLRLSRSTQKADCFGLSDGDTLIGEPPGGDVAFLENGLSFVGDVVRGQKTGYFFDQRDNRQLVRTQAEGAEVLDLFSSTGGFSAYAATGGASSVVSVDSNRASLDAAVRNVQRNEQSSGIRHQVVCDDAFEILDDYVQQGRRFDIVVVDPPSFAQRQSDVAGALRAHSRLADLALRTVRAGGLYVHACCSSRVLNDDFYRTIESCAQAAGIELGSVRHTGHGIDHPVSFAQGSYLKALFARV